MNLKEFVKSLNQFEWEAWVNGPIRSLCRQTDLSDAAFCCPLTRKFEKSSHFWGDCSEELGIDDTIAEAIVFAADETVEKLTMLNTRRREHPDIQVIEHEGDISNLIELRTLLFRELSLDRKFL